MERYTEHIIETEYGRIVCTNSSNECFSEMDGTDIQKVIKRIEALDNMLADYDENGEFGEIEDKVIDAGGKEKLLYESLRDIQSLALVLIDQVKILDSNYDGALTIMEGMRDERFEMCKEIDKLNEENVALRARNSKLEKENIDAKIKIKGFNDLIDKYLKK